jgi:hypothetical protein
LHLFKGYVLKKHKLTNMLFYKNVLYLYHYIRATPYGKI